MSSTKTLQKNQGQSTISSVKNAFLYGKTLLLSLKKTLTITLEGNKPKNSIAVLDSVRAIAMLSVILFHIAMLIHPADIPWLDRHIVALIMADYAGVTLFLVLSGFLLFLPYIKSLLFESDWPSVRSFYLRRALRIFPAYYLALFLMVFLWQRQYLQPEHWKELVLFLVFLMDSFHSTYQKLNGPFWTLAVEWQYYMILPWLCLAMRPLVQRGSLVRRIWKLVFCLTLLVAWGIFSRYFGGYLEEHPPVLSGFAHTLYHGTVALLYGVQGKNMEDFGVGMLAAVFYTLARNTPQGQWNRWLRRLSPWLLLTGMLGWAFVAQWNAAYYGGNVVIQKQYGVIFTTFHEAGFALAYGAFMLATLFSTGIIKRIFEWTPLRWIGLLSYSMYIWHGPILGAITEGIGLSPFGLSTFKSISLYIVLMMIIVIPFSFANYVLVEKPFMRISDRLRRAPSDKKQADAPKAEAVVASVPALTSSTPLALHAAELPDLLVVEVMPENNREQAEAISPVVTVEKKLPAQFDWTELSAEDFADEAAHRLQAFPIEIKE